MMTYVHANTSEPRTTAMPVEVQTETWRRNKFNCCPDSFYIGDSSAARPLSTLNFFISSHMANPSRHCYYCREKRNGGNNALSSILHGNPCPASMAPYVAKSGDRSPYQHLTGTLHTRLLLLKLDACKVPNQRSAFLLLVQPALGQGFSIPIQNGTIAYTSTSGQHGKAPHYLNNSSTNYIQSELAGVLKIKMLLS